jgi:hypothetical protein
MVVAFFEDHVSVTGCPTWTEAAEALRATLGDAADGASCAAATGFSPLAIGASATKPIKTEVRSEWKGILFIPWVMSIHTNLEAPKCPHSLVQGLLVQGLRKSTTL